jgi:hypothetical protein
LLNSEEYTELIENREGRNLLLDLGVDGTIILKLFCVGCEGVKWIHLAHDGDQCLALVDSVVNHLVP